MPPKKSVRPSVSAKKPASKKISKKEEPKVVPKKAAPKAAPKRPAPKVVFKKAAPKPAPKKALPKKRHIAPVVLKKVIANNTLPCKFGISCKFQGATCPFIHPEKKQEVPRIV